MSPPTDHPTATTSAESVRSVALDYIEGWYLGDAERMERSLHSDLVKRTPNADDGLDETGLRRVSKERMVELTAAGGGRGVADPAIEVVVDDVGDGLACAHTICADFVDYLHLIETPAGWKIANILFRMVE